MSSTRFDRDVERLSTLPVYGRLTRRLAREIATGPYFGTPAQRPSAKQPVCPGAPLKPKTQPTSSSSANLEPKLLFPPLSPSLRIIPSNSQTPAATSLDGGLNGWNAVKK
jgi:hypothetical protein